RARPSDLAGANDRSPLRIPEGIPSMRKWLAVLSTLAACAIVLAPPARAATAPAAAKATAAGAASAITTASTRTAWTLDPRASDPRPREIMNGAELELALRKLQVMGTALFIAAHPDDENSALLAYLSRERKVRAAYLSI